MKQLRRRIANTHYAQVGMLIERLRYQPGGIRKINEPCLRRESLDYARMCQCNWYGAQRHSDAARPRGFLARKTIFDRRALVSRPRGHTSNAHAAQDKGAALHGRFQ